MRVATLASEDDFDGWRDAARNLAAARVPPSDVVWQVGERPSDLFGDEALLESHAPPLRVPRPFVDLARTVALHADPERWALLYTALTRVLGQPKLVDDRADPLMRRLDEMAKAVRRDIHKMRAFVRFREVEEDDGATRYVAWFEPEHHIVRENARFFVNRFTAMTWSILTPELSVHWDGTTLGEGPGATKADAPAGDPIEEVWKTYYASIFNPARLKVGAMLKEMPRKYWKNMPETALVGELVAGAQAREVAMIEKARTAPGGNIDAAWAALRDEAMGCTRCDLHRHATQTVFGE
jgi:DNA polymerase